MDMVEACKKHLGEKILLAVNNHDKQTFKNFLCGGGLPAISNNPVAWQLQDALMYMDDEQLVDSVKSIIRELLDESPEKNFYQENLVEFAQILEL